MTGPARLFFDLWSLVYDLRPVQALVYRPVHEAVLARLRAFRALRVLDVGCGTGLLAVRLRRELPGARVIGCDFSAGMLARAAARDPRGPWVRGDAQRLPFREAAFDAVVCTESFHWYPDQRRALAEFYRVVVPAGLVLIETTSPHLAAIGDLAHGLSRLAGVPFTWPARARLHADLEAAGFAVEAQRWIPRLPGPVLFPAVLSIARRPT